jgi:hypothetical protein
MRKSRLCTYFISLDKISLDMCTRICFAFSSVVGEEEKRERERKREREKA